MSETKEVVGQLRVCGDCARPSPDDCTYLNGAARVMVKRAADDIERLERERDAAIIRAANQENRAEAAEAERDEARELYGTAVNLARALATSAERAEAERDALAADLAQRDALLIRAEKLRFGALTVESRGPSQWAVCDSGMVLNTSGEFEYEPLPSGRSDEFIARTRFTFADAVTHALSTLTKEPAAIREDDNG